jgi:hypothetical protein
MSETNKEQQLYTCPMMEDFGEIKADLKHKTHIESLITALTNTMSVGFAAINDRLDHINGRLGKEEIKVRVLEMNDAKRLGGENQQVKDSDISNRTAMLVISAVHIATMIILAVIVLAVK